MSNSKDNTKDTSMNNLTTTTDLSTNKGYFYKSGKFMNYKGLNWFITGLFLVGDLAGNYFIIKFLT